jgi:ribonucleoside-diphosphate reductase alpha chain
MMTQTTSGIEPVFMPVYKRRRKVNPNDKNVKIAFVDDVGDYWEEYNVFHHKFVDWLKVNKYNPEEVKKFNDEEMQKLIEKSPYYKATANDVDWIAKVNMQGAIQKWVDHSISVTVNLPEKADEELVGDLYINAWKSGCKGATIYRENSRQGVLISGKEKKNLGDKLFPNERPEEVEAKVFRFKNENGKLEDWIAFTGEINGKPYETFTGKDEPDDFHIPSYINSGKIVKTKNKEGNTRYDFKFINRHGDDVILPGISHAFNKEFHNYAILFSKILQSETPIDEILKTANKMKSENESINSWIRGFSRSLSKYVPNGTKSGELCPSCKEKGLNQKLIFQEGCMKCSCGFSKCG